VDGLEVCDNLRKWKALSTFRDALLYSLHHFLFR
jgi:hypothetical protein